MKKSTNAKIFSLILIFILEIAFSTPIQIAKAIDNAPVLQDSGNIATFIKGQSEVNVDPSITLTGINNIDGARIYIGQGFVSSEDSLVFINQNNIVGTYNSSTGVLTLSGIDTTANYQMALRSIKYKNTNLSNPSTAQRKIVFCVGGKVLYCPPTKHYYEYVSAPGISWDSAKTAAAGKSYYGLTGYLVTLTSKEENDFVQQKIAGNTWIGASDDDQLGHWTWRTGPEAGQCFWDRTTGSQGKTSSDGNYTYYKMYNNWDFNEPNNYQNINERYAHMYSDRGTWNDFRIDNTSITGYVVEYSESNPENPTLHLTAEVPLNVYASPSSTPILSASPQHADNMINLSWNPNDSAQTYHYMVSKKDVNLNETSYQTIPLKATAKVLNIYPGGGTAIAGVTDLDGRGVDTSGNAKQWMQTYGNGKITLDSVYIDNFSSNPDKYLKDSNGNYKYDVVFVGSWDSNNSKDISSNARTSIQAFINAGGGYLAGHDTSDVYDKVNLVTLARDNMNMVCDTALGLYGVNRGNVNISVLKKGSLVNYPWNLSSNTLSVPASHTTNQFAKGYVWMKYDSADAAWSSLRTSYGGSTGTNNFYLTTWNNTAMIQTGHSNGAATVDEQKILANTLLYLSQVSSETSFSDHTAQDVTAPNAVSNVGINIDIAKKAKIVFDAAVDSGNTYEYQLKAFGNTDKKTYTSNTVQSTITSGIKGYALVVDKNSSTDPGNSVTTTSNSFTSDALTNGTWYVHIKAIDNAGNVSSIVHKSFNVDTTAPTFSISGNGAAWTNSNVTLTINASDSDSGLNAAGAYSFDGGSTWTTTNSKSFSVNGTVNIKIRDNSGNIASQDVVIDKIDKTAPVIASVTGNPSNWTNGDVTLTVNASDVLSGLAAAAYSFDGGSTWQAENTKTYTENTSNIVVKVKDAAGNIASYNPIDITKLDKTAPTNAKITVKDKEFTTILNKITFGIFFKDTVNVSITADDNISGIKTTEYQKVEKDTDYDPKGTWTSGSSFNVAPDDKFIVYARVTDNAGNYVVVNSDGIVVDATSPALALTPDAADWTSENVNVKVDASDNLAGVKEVTYTTNETVPQTGTVAINSGAGNIKLSNEGQYKLTVTAKDNSLNEVTQTANIKIDKTAPEITSVTGNPSNWTSSDVTLTVNASDALSGLAASAYSFDGGITWQAENTRTYTENTSNIAVKVKDVAGNIAIYSPIDITKIDNTAPNTAVIANSDKYTDSNWYNNTQTVTASFTATAGCIEKLQYKVNTGAWTDDESLAISDEGKHDVSFRVIDSLGRASAVQTVKVNVDNTAPANAKITVKDREFTSILNKITFGIFFKDTVNVSITADGNISGIKKIEYQKVAKDTDYNANGTWKSGSSFDVTPDEKFIVYARVTDNAGNYVVVNSDGIIVDSTNPDLTLTSDAADWTNSDVNVKVEASDKLAGVKEVTYTTDEKVPQSGTVAISNGAGTIKLSNEGQYKLTVTAKDNSDNEVSQNVEIKIDRTMPKLAGAAEASNYFIGRVIKFTDDFGEIASVTYKKDAADEVSFNNEALFDNPGKYDLTLKDKAGNVAKLSFEIKAMPKVEEVIYTADCKALIDSIRAEFDSHNDLPEPYKTNTDNEIKALEARYAKLHKEVMDIKSETSVIKSKVDVLPNGIDGLISLKKEIQDEYNKIAGSTSTLTKEQRLALEKEAEYLKQQLDIIVQLESQIEAVKTRVSSIDTKVDGLISKESSIKEILTDIDKLTKEQKDILQPQIDILNGLLTKINGLKEEVEAVKGMISKLPSPAKLTKENLEQLTSAEKAYNKLTNEQKSLVGDSYGKLLNDCLNALRKLMLHNEENDLTVIGIDGTSFDSAVYLVVTPIKADSANINAKFAISAESVKKAAENTQEIKNKELVALYDVSLFKDNVKIQPDGKVKVKVKVPEELKGRSGLDIVHIADDGTVTPMHAVVEDGYLVFITTHFSDYAIVAEPIAKTIPKTGSAVDFNSLVIGGVLLIIAGLVAIRKQRRKA